MFKLSAIKPLVLTFTFWHLLTGAIPSVSNPISIGQVMGGGCYLFAAVAAGASAGACAKALGILPPAETETELDAGAFAMQATGLALVALLAYQAGRCFTE